MQSLTAESVTSLPVQDKHQLLSLLAERDRRTRTRKILSYYPDEGPLRRELYPKHLEFFAAGAVHKERLLLGGNRAGKSFAGSYEVACHLTGWYPKWWQGKVFDCPTNWIVAGDTARTTRDIIQEKLLGTPGAITERGTGMVPAEFIEHTTAKAGVPDAIENAHVKHVSGGISVCQFRSFDQGREIFQGTAQHGIWLDEEVPIEIWVEALMRTMTTEGIIFGTMTPLRGLTPLVLSFLPDWNPAATA